MQTGRRAEMTKPTVAFGHSATKPKSNGVKIVLVQEPIRKRSLGILKRIIEECGMTSMHTAHANLRTRIGAAAL